MHPLDAFRVWIRVGSFFVKIDFDGFRASVELSFDAAPVSVTCSKSKIWPRTTNIFSAKFHRKLMSKKVVRLNGCTISLTFENAVCRIYLRRLRWLHEKPQK